MTKQNSFILPLGRRAPEIAPMSNRPWYDTREGLEARLKSGLDGLREIQKARREAGYDHKERLSEWCLLGLFYADTCGNFSLITEGSPADARAFISFEKSRRLTDVLTREEMNEFTEHWTATFGPALPPVGATCDRCGRGWALNNVRDFYCRSEQSPRHRECHRLAVIEREIKMFGDILERAEIPFSALHMIPNEYYRDPDYFGPWFIVETPRGRLKIGWRKRVINIDWGGTALHVPDTTFADEDVTKGQTSIHAWGVDKAVEYLRRVWKCGG